MNAINCVKLSDGLWQFCDAAGFRCHLLAGTKQALLIDAMGGIGDLRKEIGRVTDLDVTVALTHGHFDHIGGAFRFPEAFLPRAEQAALPAELHHIQELRRYLETKQLPPEQMPACLRYEDAPVFLDIQEGDILNLGGLTVQTVALPGHTAGSVGYLCAEKKLLFVGDAATPVMCLFFEDSLPIEGYRATLAKMRALPFDYFLTSHHAKVFPKALLGDFDACAAFAEHDRGMYFQHDFLPEYRGNLHVYRGTNSEADDFLAIISRYLPHERKKHRADSARRSE